MLGIICKYLVYMLPLEFGAKAKAKGSRTLNGWQRDHAAIPSQKRLHLGVVYFQVLVPYCQNPGFLRVVKAAECIVEDIDTCIYDSDNHILTSILGGPTPARLVGQKGSEQIHVDLGNADVEQAAGHHE